MRSAHVADPERWVGEPESNVLPIRPVIGAQPPSTNLWLDDLAVGQTFVCKGTGLTSPLYEYTLKGRHKPSGIVLLRENLIQGKEDLSEQQWYLTSYFCSIFNLVTTLE